MTAPTPERQSEVAGLLRRIGFKRALARAALVFESAWPALWPPLGVAGLFLIVALLDLPRLLPAWLHIGLLVVTGVAILVLLGRGLRDMRAPSMAAADRRLEVRSGLAHRPLSVLSDAPVRPDPASAALWQIHVARAIRQVRRLRVGVPRPGLARRDRRALRGGLLVALVAAFVIAGDDAPSRLAGAMEPALPREQGPPATELQAWITPPAYTRLAPLFLKTDTGAVSVPAGSHLTVNVTGGSGQPSLSLGGHAGSFRSLDDKTHSSSFQADQDLTRGGRLIVRRGGHELAAWDLTVVADQKPVAAWDGKPGRAANSQQTRLPWRASDDYGVASLQAELRLKERPDAPPVVLALPLPGGQPKSAHGTTQHDLTANPWAGLAVIARLIARDGAGQQGESDDAEFVLPERPFQNPLARAAIAIRKGLSLHPEDRNSAVAGLDEMLMQAPAFGRDSGAYVNLAAIYYLLEFDKSDDAIPQAQQRLWELALHLEEGQTEQTARALDQARQAAREALDKATREPTEANRQELEKRLKELEQAIEKHMQALLDELRRNNTEMPFDPSTRQLSNRDLQRMAEDARRAAQEGRMKDAQQRMAELERMLDQLRNARPQTAEQARRAQEQRQRGRQQMGALQDMIGRQGGLLDHAQRRAQETQPREFGQPPQPQTETQATDPKQEQEADARVQQALRRALGELMQQFGDLTNQVPPSLGEADQAMRDAGRQLGQGNDKAAGNAEQRAIAALQKGGREMGQAMARQFGPARNGEDSGEPDSDGSLDGSMGLSMGQDGRGDARGDGTLAGPPDRGNPEGRDPLGRRYGQGSSGADESSDVTIPSQRERQRTRAIQEELRRRGADRERPQPELDYIDRLLRQF